MRRRKITRFDEYLYRRCDLLRNHLGGDLDLKLFTAAGAEDTVVLEARLSFPDDLWARVVYDFALGHHYGVVHRDHLLRSLTPLYLGRTAAFVLATATTSAASTGAQMDAVGTAFERQKPYLVEHWR